MTTANQLAGIINPATGQIYDANAPSGSVIQVVSAAKTDMFSTTSQSFVDVTGLSVSITPSSTNSKIMIICGLSLGATAGSNAIFPRITRNGSVIFVNDAAGSRIQASAMYEVGNAATFPIAINFLDAPSTTSSVTYSVQVRVNGFTGRVNGSRDDSDVNNWSRSVSSITVMEIAA